MFFRKSKTKAAKRELARGNENVSELAEKVASVAGQAAERAVGAASSAGRAAAPAARKTAHVAAGTLSDAAEKLADAAERFANSDTGLTAREKFADTAESMAATVRPKKKHHRVRKLLIVGAVVGAIVGVVRSPLPGKLADKLFGAPPEDDEFDTITLPSDDSEALEPEYHGSGATATEESAESEDSPAR